MYSWMYPDILILECDKHLWYEVMLQALPVRMKKNLSNLVNITSQILINEYYGECPKHGEYQSHFAQIQKMLCLYDVLTYQKSDLCLTIDNLLI